jgi:hypothetical protein
VSANASIEAVAASLWRLSLATDGTRVDLVLETIDGREETLRVETDGFDYDTRVGGAAGGLNVSAQWLPTWLCDLPADGSTHAPARRRFDGGNDGLWRARIGSANGRYASRKRRRRHSGVSGGNDSSGATD